MPPSLGDDCWILSGPTAAGKTALGIEIARRLDAEIVSVDSKAVYRCLDTVVRGFGGGLTLLMLARRKSP